jgi:hypothetical protein
MYQGIPNVRKIFQMAMKYINIFPSKVLQNLPKLVFLQSGNPVHKQRFAGEYKFCTLFLFGATNKNVIKFFARFGHQSKLQLRETKLKGYLQFVLWPSASATRRGCKTSPKV